MVLPLPIIIIPHLFQSSGRQNTELGMTRAFRRDKNQTGDKEQREN